MHNDIPDDMFHQSHDVLTSNHKEEYKKNFTNEINEIRDQNKDLAARNDKLAKSNEELQKQLRALQEKVLGE